MTEVLASVAFGKAVREHRLEVGMSQSVLARLIGVSRQTLIRYEQGGRPTLDQALSLAAALNFSLDPFRPKGMAEKARDLIALVKQRDEMDRLINEVST